MKVLNLDKLAVAQRRQLVIDGTKYAIEEMTVSNFIETTKAAERLVGASILEQVEATVDLVLRSVPTVSREVLSAMKLETLQAVVAFVRGDDVEGVEVQGGDEATEKK